MWKKLAVGIAVAGASMLAVAPAHAGGHWSVSVGVGAPVPGYYTPPPAYYGPPTVYAAPPVVYGPPAPVYYAPRYIPPRHHRHYGPPVIYRPAPIGYGVRPLNDPYWR